MWSYNWDFSSSFQQARGLKSQRIFKNALCRNFFDFPEPQLSSITTETGTEVENYDTCINPSVKLGHDLYYCLYWVRYAKSDQNHVSRPLFKVLWSDSLPTVKTIRYLKSKGKMTLSTYRLFPTNNLIFKG